MFSSGFEGRQFLSSTENKIEPSKYKFENILKRWQHKQYSMIYSAIKPTIWMWSQEYILLKLSLDMDLCTYIP